MAEPVNAATASAANDEDDADDLYADFDEQVAAALAAAGESGGSNARDSNPVTDGEGEVPDADANEVVDLGDGTADYSSSGEESDDGLHIVLNEDAGPPPPPAARREGYVAEDEDGEDLGSHAKGPSVNDGSLGQPGELQCKGLLERTTVSIVGQGDGGRQHLFQNDINFFLPRNCTIFDINIEAFQLKPWRQHGVDLTDYFNFDLDEEGWRKYWLSMKQVRQGSRSFANVPSGLGQSCKVESIGVMPKEPNYPGHEGRNGLSKPKGRAIHVEDRVGERIPSAEMWRPVQRDSDVVIQVNMMHSPSNQSTSDDSSTLNHRISIDHHGDRHLKDSSIVVGRVIDKEVHDRGSSEYAGNKLYRRDPARARDQSSSPGYSDTLSEESKEDLYFKRANRHSDSTDSYEDTKLKDEHVRSDLYCNSSESGHGNSKKDYLGRSYTPPVDDKYQQADKVLQRDEDSSVGQGGCSELLINYKSGQHLPKSGHKARREQKRQPLAPGRCAVFDERDKSTSNYPRRCVRKYEQKFSNSTLQSNNYHYVHGELYGKQGYPRPKRVALRYEGHYLNSRSIDHHNHGRSSRCKFSEEDVEGFASAKEWWRHRDDGYDSMLEAEVSNINDGQMYREMYYEETTASHGHDGNDEFLHYTDYRFRRSESPDFRARYSNRRICAKSIDGHLKPHDHLASYPRLNLSNSQRDWPAAGVTSMSSRNRCIGNKRIHNAKMVQYHYDGYHQNKHHDSSFHADSIAQSALYTDAVAGNGRCILPVKRKLHADLGSVNHKNIADLSLPKGIKIMHDQSVVSDREIYAVRLHNSSKEFYTEATFCSNDMTKSTTISNIGIEARHELRKGNSNDRKIKFRRRGNQLIREVENDGEGRLSVGDDLHGSKHKDIGQNMQGQNRGYGYSGNQVWEKSAYQKQQNEDVEIEEGELIEQDIFSKGELRRPKKLALKSVINVASEDAACKNGTKIECDNKCILEVMAKMQKRRERFKEARTTQKGNDGEKKELLAAACSTDDIRNQRPARKRLWGGVC